MIRRKAVIRSSAESGSAACSSTTNDERPEEADDNLVERHASNRDLDRALVTDQTRFVTIALAQRDIGLQRTTAAAGHTTVTTLLSSTIRENRVASETCGCATNARRTTATLL